MASILPGFEFDIFVSYRHKDNKYDHWVTEFVTNLKKEIGATFKEDISIYFDNNPHDGLLETHHVDKSLEAKLKSIIFIPIISQTYCDTLSFAWQHEFCVFNRLSKADQFGRDIRLSNGNVASRILPVKIHELDPEDYATLEEELGGPLRSVEFIFKSAGVNRPLHANDKREENISKLFYRDQINKVANAIKEITNGIKYPDRRIRAEEPKPAPSTDNGKAAGATSTGKSIAVLPFVNLSHDNSQEYFADGITENILIQLASLKQLRVISRTSMMRYKKTDKSAPEIAAELSVKYILEGSAQMHGNKVRIQVQLIDGEKDDHIWSKAFVESLDDIFAIQNNVAEVVASELLSSLAPPKDLISKSVPTRNLEAYDLFLKGRHAFNQWGVEGYRLATEYFKQAIGLDPDFQEAYSYLASSYSARMSWNGDLTPAEARQHILLYLPEALKRGATDNDHLTQGFVEFFINKDFKATERSFLAAIEMNPNNALAIYTYSYLLDMTGRFDEALKWVSKARLIEPMSVAYFNYQTIALHLSGQYEKALATVQEGLRLYPSVLRFYDFLARIYVTMRKWREAEDAVLAGFRTSTVRPPSMVAFQAIACASLNKKDKFQDLLQELLRRSEAREREVNVNIIYVYTAIGDFHSGAHWHQMAQQTNDVGLIWWNADPLFKDLRDAQPADRLMTSPDFVAAESHIIKLLKEGMPKLPYHNIEHVYNVLEAAVRIGKEEHIGEREVPLIRLAALLHDLGFKDSSLEHELRGAQIARETLPAFGLNSHQIEIIVNMILATKLPQTPSTKLEEILCDADLDYLGRDDFYEIGGKLYEEMKMNGVVETEREWNILQKAFLETHRFHTPFGKSHRESVKITHLQEIMSKLKSR